MSEHPPPAIPEEIPEPAEPGHHLDPPPGEGGTPHGTTPDQDPPLEEAGAGSGGAEGADDSWVASDVP